MSKAIYAFSGDPCTFGHLNIVQRVAETFDEVVVGIGVNPKKNYMFSLEERKDMAERMFKKLSNVTVTSFEGLLVDYAYEQGIHTIVRGIRNAQDLEYEQTVHTVGASQKLGVETFCLFADSSLAHISSSAVKALQQESGFIHDFVPLHVKQALEREMSGRYMLGVTGTIGAGKSYSCKAIKKWCDSNGVPCTYIDLDKVAKEILNERMEPAYVKVRELIALTFPPNVMQDDGFINRAEMGKLVFNDHVSLGRLNSMMAQPILVRLVDALRKATGLVLVESALLVEADMMKICNNNVLLVTVDKKRQRERLQERKYAKGQVDRRISSQFTEDMKFLKIKEEIEKHGHGSVWKFTPNLTSMRAVLGSAGYPIHTIRGKSNKNWYCE